MARCRAGGTLAGSVGSQAGDALISVAAFGQALLVTGTGRGDKPREEVLRPAALEAYLGRRARKGRRQDAVPKALRVTAAEP